MPTLRDVATLAGVSIATVSHVVNKTRRITPATRVRVEQAIAQLGYVPNSAGRLLALQKSGNKSLKSAPDEGSKFSEDRSAPFDQYDKSLTDASSHSEASSLMQADRTSRMLLRLLRAAQPISRVEIARRFGVRRSVITELTRPLIAAGIVREETAQRSTRASRSVGRPPVGLTLSGEKGLFVGVNIGVRGSQVGITTLGGEILAEEEFETPTADLKALTLIRTSIERLRNSIPGRPLRMIGVSVPGPTEAQRRKLLYAPRLGWRDVPVADSLRFSPEMGVPHAGADVPVVVENDATAAAMYEARLRLRDTVDGSLDNFVLVRSGTGIGVGLVIDGEVYRGTDHGEGFAGEFGHMTIVAGGKQCVCGNRGCWESYASASAASSLYMGDRIKLGAMKAPRYLEIVARAETGEIRAQRTLERVGEYLGIGIGNVITGLGVPRVIVSGRVVYGWKFIQHTLREAVGQSMAGKLAGWSVEPGEPRGAGLGGAFEVAVEEYLVSNFSSSKFSVLGQPVETSPGVSQNRAT